MDQNQNIYQFRYPIPPESILREESPQGTLGFERVSQYVYIDIHGAEIAELRRRIERLEERRTQFVAIQNLNSKKLELKIPLVVTIEPTDQDTFIVWCEDLNTYGEGEDEEEAKNDFLKNVEELYFDLKKDKEKLGSALEKIWQYMQKIIKEV